MDGELVMTNFNDNLTIMLIGFETLLLLMFLITLIYTAVQHYRSYKEARILAKKFEIYNKYRL